jgi:hypothetical protein
MKIIFVACLFMIATGIALSQPGYVEKGKWNSVGEIFYKNGEKLKVNNFGLLNDSIISYKSSGSNAIQNINISKVNFLFVKNGSHILSYALLGTGMGLAGGLLSVPLTKSSQSYKDIQELGGSINMTPIIIGSTVACGLIGTLMGSLSVKWQKLNIPGRTDTGSYFILPEVNNKTYGIYFSFSLNHKSLNEIE